MVIKSSTVSRGTMFGPSLSALSASGCGSIKIPSQPAATAAFNNGLTSGTGGAMTWDTSSVTTTASMFKSASAFNQNLDSLRRFERGVTLTY